MEPAPGHTSEPIVIHLEESAEPEDVNDNAGAVMPNDQVEAVAVGPNDQVESQIDARSTGTTGPAAFPATAATRPAQPPGGQPGR